MTILPGEYVGPLEPQKVVEPDPVVLFAGRHIPEKQVPSIPPAIAEARRQLPDLRAVILGDGPDRPQVEALVRKLGLEGTVEVRGFVETEVVEQMMTRALCLLLPSRREGYGLVVIEAASAGTPSVVVAGPDNAAVELVEDGVNGFIATSAAPDDLASAILRVYAGGQGLRLTTARWFEHNAPLRSLSRSLEIVLAAYAGATVDWVPPEPTDNVAS